MSDFARLRAHALAHPIFDPADWGGSLPSEFMKHVGKGWTVGLSINK